MPRISRPKPDYNGWVFGDVEPLDEIYAECILQVCPTCHAQEGDFCISRITHKVSKLPCISRMKL
jgi:hypothetical protein